MYPTGWALGPELWPVVPALLLPRPAVAAAAGGNTKVNNQYTLLQEPTGWPTPLHDDMSYSVHCRSTSEQPPACSLLVLTLYEESRLLGCEPELIGKRFLTFEGSQCICYINMTRRHISQNANSQQRCRKNNKSHKPCTAVKMDE